MFTCAPALVEAIGHHELRIVVSSSWRFHRSADEIASSLPAALARRIVGQTGEAHVGRWARYHEVKRWLEMHEPEALRSSPGWWRALDDAVFEFPGNCSELIACSPREGFGPRQAATLLSWLAGWAGTAAP